MISESTSSKEFFGTDFATTGACLPLSGRVGQRVRWRLKRYCHVLQQHILANGPHVDQREITVKFHAIGELDEKVLLHR